MFVIPRVGISSYEMKSLKLGVTEIVDPVSNTIGKSSRASF